MKTIADPAGNKPTDRKHMGGGTVEGVLGLTPLGSSNIRTLRSRSEQDVEIISTWDDAVIGPLPPEINLITLPGIPRNSEPLGVFRDGADAWDLEGNLSRRDAVLQQTVTYSTGQHTGPWGNCLTSEGYFLYNPSDLEKPYHYERTPVTGDQLISLPSGSATISYYSQIGSPFGTEVQWAECWITDGVSQYQLDDDQNPWLHAIKYWNGSAWIDVDFTAQGSEMQPWTFYLVYPKVDNLALIVPDPG